MSKGARRQPLSLKARAVALLAQREHSALELRRKLTRILREQARALAQDSTVDPTQDQGPSGEHSLELNEPHGDTVSEVDDVLAWLQSSGYLDESRFVESRLHVRSQRWGQRRIEQELAQHGLTLDADQRASLASTELERACEQLARKFGAAQPEDPGADAADPAAEARQMRFLLGRGFGTDVARRAIRAHRAGGSGDAR